MKGPIISDENAKLVNIPNIGMTPGKACANCSACRRDCYAIRPYKRYPNVKKAWDHNFRLARHVTAWRGSVRDRVGHKINFVMAGLWARKRQFRSKVRKNAR